MTSYSCTCSDPKEKICMTHKAIKFGFFEYHWFRFREQFLDWWVNTKFEIAIWFLGDDFYNIVYICPECGNHFCPARPDERHAG